MAEPGNPMVTWAERMELLKDSTQQRVLNAPMPPAAMEQLIVDERAHALGLFKGSPVNYMGRWWRLGEEGWVVLDEAASAQLDLHAARYWAASAAAGAPSAADAALVEVLPPQLKEGAA
ncbi:hypothetical protein [Streptomyces sp. NPDC059783]|uniref:hypothetical protein n=1 Tax=Streptomyces sp. NPDC059783 TaxID=3346944 RepID=UPI0036687BD8